MLVLRFVKHCLSFKAIMKKHLFCCFLTQIMTCHVSVNFLSSLGTISAVHDVFNTSKQMWKYLSCLFQNYQFYFGLWCVLKRTEEVTSVKRICFYLANIGSNQAKFSTHNYIVFTIFVILLPADRYIISLKVQCNISYLFRHYYWGTLKARVL